MRLLKLIGQIKYKTLWGSALALPLFLSASASAQTASAPQFMVTWQAENYGPADFMGKLLPITNTPIEATFNLLQAGKVLDLSKTEIRWYVNDKLLADGKGIQVLQFTAPELFQEDQQIKIDIPSYQGKELVKNLAIPVVSPEVVIQARLLSNTISYGAAHFKALPYFFNITNIMGATLHWFVNDVEPKSSGAITNPDELTIQTPKEIPVGSQTEVKVSLQNRKNDTEFATQALLLRVGQ